MKTTTIETLKIAKLNKTIETFEEMNAVTKNDSARRSMGHVINRLRVQVLNLECRVELREELAALATDMSGLDHNHESATNWLHELHMSKNRPAILRATEDQWNDAHDRLMEIQAEQDELGARIWKLRQHLNN